MAIYLVVGEKKYGAFYSYECQNGNAVFTPTESIKAKDTISGLLDGLEPNPSDSKIPDSIDMQIAQKEGYLYKVVFNNPVIPIRRVSVLWYTKVDGTGHNDTETYSDEKTDVNLTVSPDVFLVDMLGNVFTNYSITADNKLHLQVGEKPVYVVENFNGLRASYYNNPIYWNNVNAIATPDVERIDPNIDFDWRSFGRNDPLPSGINEDDAWSADWTGFINIPSDGTYKFDLNSDDGSWLFIDGKLVIDNDNGDHPPRDKYNSTNLTKGYHSINVRYFECCWGGANINLYWMPPGETTYKIVPPNVLYVSSPQELPPILQLSKNAPANMDPGNAMVYTLYYNNFGNTIASNVVLNDTLPSNVTFINASDGGTYDSATRNVTWNIDSIAAFPSGQGSRTVTVRISNTVAIGTPIQNIATISYGNNPPSSTASAQTTVTKSNLPQDVSVGPTNGNTGGTPSVYWQTPVTFSYYSPCATSIGINIHFGNGVPDITDSMTKSSQDMWTYTKVLYPGHGDTTVTYTIKGCNQEPIKFNIYVDPAGFIYDAATGARISGASVWLQQPDGQGGWENVSTGQTPPVMQPDVNPLITGSDGQYQWDVLKGSYRVHVEAPGYYPADSIVVSVPPPVNDLHVGLTRLPDSIPPTTNLILSGTLGNNSWYISDVQVNLTATDNEGGSGVNTTEYSLDNATWNAYTAPFNITTEGTTTIFYHSIDNASNVEPTKNQTINIDKTPPEIILTTPTNGANYMLNENINAIWSASDSGSGIATVTATTPNGSLIDTATIGAKTFSVNATDNASNQAIKTAVYSIVYNYSGVLPPLGKDAYKLGSTIPVKFQLWDANRNYIATATARIYLAKVTNGVVGNEIEGVSSGNANTGNVFRNADKQYIFNLNTKPLSAGTWQIRISLDDGTSKYVTVGLKS